MDIYDVQDFLYHFPNYHHDFSKIVSIKDLNYEKIQTIKISIDSFQNIRLRGKRAKSMQRAKVSDESGKIEVVWFNQPFLVDIFKKANEVYLAAVLNPSSNRLQISNPEYEVAKGKKAIHLARITPVYSLTHGVKQKWLRSKIKWLIDKIDYITDLEETLPENIKKEFGLLDLKPAIKNIHFPENQKKLKKAKHRIGFEEILAIQIKLEKARSLRKNKKGPKININIESKTQEFKNSLSFELTNDQKNAIEDIKEDLKKQNPMFRLLHGDVGCGKTMIAIFTALCSAKSSYQTAVMAPTTVLAKQLFNEFSKHLKPFNIQTKLITSEKKNESIKKTENTVFVGTHSLLFQEKNLFSNLGLIIIDEQHRFGVEQRKQLLQFGEKKSKNFQPHYLMMTATPIPRTMAITFFGDMDLSLIKEKPKNKKPVHTFFVPQQKRNDSYEWIRKKVKNGDQVFWVCPLIEESNKLQAKSLKKTFNELKKIYPEFKLKSLHGKIKENEKNKIIKNFKNEQFNILVSTSVIEVGIDIEKANIIVIEGAERFGLAQLHQLRGRVGRHFGDAFCLLFTSNDKLLSKDAKERLKYFASENNGLRISEYDLKRRGPGEVYGTKQAGIPDLKVATLSDIKLIKETKQAAIKLIR